MNKTKKSERLKPAPVRVQPVVSGHIRKLHDFVKHITNYGEDPSSWPLTPEEQSFFVRTVIYQARQLQKTEEYRLWELGLASEDLARAS